MKQKQKKLKVKGITDTDFVNYKEPCMFIAFPHCNFKCGRANCQNHDLVNSPDIEIDIEEVVQMFVKNPLTKAIVCGGMDPIDTFDMLYAFIDAIRAVDESTIIIYTGYNKNEILPEIKALSKFSNILIKYGRYLPNNTPFFDYNLGIELASSNQYSEFIS